MVGMKFYLTPVWKYIDPITNLKLCQLWEIQATSRTGQVRDGNKDADRVFPTDTVNDNDL